MFNHRERAKQLNNFIGIVRIRGISPTDIDGLIDYGGKSFIYLEGKLKTAPFPYGQKLALENISKSHLRGGNETLIIIYRHNTPVEKDIIVKACFVEKIYFKKKWYEVKNKKVIQVIESWENYIFKNK